MSTPALKSAIANVAGVPRGLEGLADADEESVRTFYAQLVESREAATADLRHQAYRNYGQFVVISKEISNILCAALEDDMMMLREVITELKDIGEELSKDSKMDSNQHGGKANQRSEDKNSKNGRSGQTDPEDELPAELRWMGDLTDELDVYIAHREFDDAVECIENTKNTLAAWQKDGKEVWDMGQKIKDRSEKLSVAIEDDFKNPLLTRQQLERRVRWLLRLGYEEKARDSFLTSRTALIRERTRQLSSAGDVRQYVDNITMVMFTLVRNTSLWYNQLFNNPAVASSFMRWLQQEMEFFAEKFRRRVFFDQQTFAIVAECMQRAINECGKLREIGLDVNFMLEQMLVKNLSETIELYEKVCADTLSKSLLHDRFRMTGVNVDGSTAVQLTVSTAKLYKLVNELVRDMSLLSSVPIYTTVVSSTSTIIERYLKLMLATCQEIDLDDKQRFAVLADVGFVSEFFLPRVTSRIAKMFGRPVPELQALRNRLGGFPSTLQEVLCDKKALLLLRKAYPFATIDYAYEEVDDNFGKPTKEILQLVKSLHRMALEIRQHPIDLDSIMANVVEKLFKTIGEPVYWGKDKEQRRFGYAGSQQFVLDMHFMLKVCDKYVSESAFTAANAVCERALRHYIGNNRNLKKDLQTGDWYDKNVSDAIARSGKEIRRFGEEAI
ncbi:Cullin repeat-like-containing domain protein [Thamnocephalis sphaerospora]|uniref:Cullin repeat-like-containing domain protein n=1 Tax=Thamnocephalis sphaerospora TaxID=78915 RepID=A0A4P9XQ53_9FUNG|nr:Cullin repeat-like-containing domain protein [Thamnocephalis sphaerospora]|eukprot:RKP08157.1 Cullin repeat-like-containing domain protein [Thamnocephalis sphaerospora]